MSTAEVEVETDPQLERRTRRRVNAAEKQRLLAESEQLAHGELAPPRSVLVDASLMM